MNYAKAFTHNIDYILFIDPHQKKYGAYLSGSMFSLLVSMRISLYFGKANLDVGKLAQFDGWN